MTDEKTVRGTSFTCFHAGPMEGWAQFHMDPPEVPRPARGKLFLRKFLGSAGLEMSLNVLPPGKGMPLPGGTTFSDISRPADPRNFRRNSLPLTGRGTSGGSM